MNTENNFKEKDELFGNEPDECTKKKSNVSALKTIEDKVRWSLDFVNEELRKDESSMIVNKSSLLFYKRILGG